MSETWKDIPNFEELYQLSSMGRVRSKDRVYEQLNHGKVVKHFYPGQLVYVDKSSSADAEGAQIVRLCCRRHHKKLSLIPLYAVMYGQAAAEALFFPNEFVRYPDEEWRDIDGFDGRYQISNHGNIQHRVGGDAYGGYTYLMMRTVNNVGYRSVSLYVSPRKARKYLIHQLVARAFIPNPENKPDVNHINGVKYDNFVENLEWVTPKENSEHAVRTGLISQAQVRQAQYSNRINNGTRMYCPELHKIFLGYKAVRKFFGISSTTINAMLHDHLSYGGVTLIDADEVI